MRILLSLALCLTLLAAALPVQASDMPLTESLIAASAAPVEAQSEVTSTQVYLTGSRFYTDTSVGGYMRTYTAGSETSALVNATATADQKAAYASFRNAIFSWPSSAQVFQQAQIAGTTSIVDRDGAILGQLDTNSIFGSGLAGMNYLGNPWGNGDYNKAFMGPSFVTITDRSGVEHQLEIVAFVAVSPIIIDLGGEGRPDVDQGEWRPHAGRFNVHRARLFDIDGCGEADLTEWVGPKSGILVAPINEVKVQGGQQLFGTALGYVDGYQKLGQLRDRNNDNKISGDELAGLQVWVDANEDAFCQPDELKSLDEIGLTELSTRHDAFRSTCVIRGKNRLTWDWWPTVAKVRPVVSR